MESSPLRFLDLDVSLMLADEVRISQEEEARAFHDNLRENSHEINLNWGQKRLIICVFKDIGYFSTPRSYLYSQNEQHIYAKKGWQTCVFKRNYERVAKWYQVNVVCNN